MTDDVGELQDQLAEARELNRKLHRCVQAEESPLLKELAKVKAQRDGAIVARDMHYRRLQIMQRALEGIVATNQNGIATPTGYYVEAITASIAIRALAQAWRVHVSHLGTPLPDGPEGIKK